MAVRFKKRTQQKITNLEVIVHDLLPHDEPDTIAPTTTNVGNVSHQPELKRRAKYTVSPSNIGDNRTFTFFKLNF